MFHFQSLFRDKVRLTFPFAKESPFLEPFKKSLFEMKKSGILKQIWNRHKTDIDNICEERKVLGQNSMLQLQYCK